MHAQTHKRTRTRTRACARARAHACAGKFHDTNQHYYFCKATGERCWDLPSPKEVRGSGAETHERGRGLAGALTGGEGELHDKLLEREVRAHIAVLLDKHCFF